MKNYLNLFFVFLFVFFASSCKFIDDEYATADLNNPSNDFLPLEDMPEANFYILKSEDDLKIKMPERISLTPSDQRKDIIFVLAKDISYSGDPITICIDNTLGGGSGLGNSTYGFNSQFYGNGRTITLTKGKPLFSVIGDGAKIRGLTVRASTPISNLIDAKILTDEGISIGPVPLNSIGILTCETFGAVELSDVTVIGDINLSSGITITPFTFATPGIPLAGLVSGGGLFVGGIAGYHDASTIPSTAPDISRCAFLGSITINSLIEFTSGSPKIYVGGLVGQGKDARIKNSFSALTMNITDKMETGTVAPQFVGGLCADILTGGTVEDSYAYGSISVSSKAVKTVSGICANSGVAAVTKCASLIKSITTNDFSVGATPTNSIARVADKLTSGTNYAYGSTLSREITITAGPRITTVESRNLGTVPGGG